MSDSKGLPTLADFSACTGNIFHASRNGDAFDLRLESTESFVANTRQTNFSVMFIAPSDVPAQQGLYTLDNESLGRMDLLLVPVASDNKGLHFEAVFNYLHDA
jgi:hypothetical protein